MNNSREAISVALFNLLQQANGTGPKQFNFQTFSRAARIWADVPDGSQPAAFLIKTGEQVSDPDAYGAKIYIVRYMLLCYAKADPTSPENSEQVLNGILDAIDYVLQTQPPGQPQTMNSLVIEAFIDGEVYCDTGILDQQIAVGIPIKCRTGV